MKNQKGKEDIKFTKLDGQVDSTAIKESNNLKVTAVSA